MNAINMKRTISVIVVIVCLLIFVGFIFAMGGGCGQRWSHMKSSMVGLDREIAVYNFGSQEPIKTWRTRSQLESDRSSVRFLVDGKAVNVYGGILISEEK